jgi:hypothetical protein
MRPVKLSHNRVSIEAHELESKTFDLVLALSISQARLITLTVPKDGKNDGKTITTDPTSSIAELTNKLDNLPGPIEHFSGIAYHTL